MTSLFDMFRSGLALVPIPQGKKGTTKKGWNDPKNLITTPSKPPKFGASSLGLAHAQCSPHTCAVHIDEFVLARAWFATRGVKLAWRTADVRSLLEVQS